jgi:hypothetical protein
MGSTKDQKEGQTGGGKQRSDYEPKGLSYGGATTLPRILCFAAKLYPTCHRVRLLTLAWSRIWGMDDEFDIYNTELLFVEIKV